MNFTSGIARPAYPHLSVEPPMPEAEGILIPYNFPITFSPIMETSFVGPFSETSLTPPPLIDWHNEKTRKHTNQLLADTEEIEALSLVQFVADYLKRKDDFESKNDDWTFAALVVNRIFFIIYMTILTTGTYYIFFMAE